MAFVAGQVLTAAALNAMLTQDAWVSWSVTFTANFTKGNATDQSKHCRVGRLIVAHMSLIIGSTTAVGTLPVFTLPVPRAAGPFGGGATVATYRDVSGSADYDGFIRLASNTSGYLEVVNKAGANDGRTGIGAAVPFTWAAGDLIDGTVIYEASS